MRFRVKHLLALMLFVAAWVPLSQWLLALEAKDHPWKPQETSDVIGFYLGTTSLLVIPWSIYFVRKQVVAARLAEERAREGAGQGTRSGDQS